MLGIAHEQVVYEDLVADPAGHASRCLERLGLQMEPGVLSPERNARAVRAASAKMQLPLARPHVKGAFVHVRAKSKADQSDYPAAVFLHEFCKPTSHMGSRAWRENAQAQREYPRQYCKRGECEQAQCSRCIGALQSKFMTDQHCEGNHFWV